MTVAAALAAAVALLQGPGAEGVVRSSADGEPIAYAQVRVMNDTAADWTDEHGEYRLEGLEPGRWQLRIAHPAHDSLDLEIFVPRDRPLQLDITLNTRASATEAPLHDFEPFQVEYTLPALLNAEEVTRRILDHYPSDLVQRRIGGEAVLRLWLDERGQVVRTLISSSTGIARLDSLAVEISDRMRFRPAKSGDRPLRVIVQIPVTFTVTDSTLLQVDSVG